MRFDEVEKERGTDTDKYNSDDAIGKRLAELGLLGGISA